MSQLRAHLAPPARTLVDVFRATVETFGDAHALDNGVEVSLGDSDDIAKKERIVTKLLSQVEGVTYINVRSPGNYTFRNAPTA